MCEYMILTGNSVPMCKNGGMCTLCIIGNKNKYYKQNSIGADEYLCEENYDVEINSNNV